MSCQVHYTPTYASWLNQVEIWFNLLCGTRTQYWKKLNDFVNYFRTNKGDGSLYFFSLPSITAFAN